MDLISHCEGLVTDEDLLLELCSYETFNCDNQPGNDGQNMSVISVVMVMLESHRLKIALDILALTILRS